MINPLISKSSNICRKVYLGNLQSISIESNSGLGRNFTVRQAFVKIGKNVMTGKDIVVLGGGHNFERTDISMMEQGKKRKTSVEIGNDVWIGERVTILAKDIVIGDGCIIGACAVITKSVPPFAVVAGNPARVKNSENNRTKVKNHPDLTVGYHTYGYDEEEKVYKVATYGETTLGVIHPLEAFFVNKGTATAITFTADMMTDGNSYAATSKNNLFSMTASNNIGQSTAMVAVGDKAKSVETLFDSNLEDVPMVYTVAGGQAVSINANCLPANAVQGEKKTYRTLNIDGDEFEFSAGFTELHTKGYQKILAGEGFRISESRPCIEIVSDIRHTTPIGLHGDYHPLAKMPLDSHPFGWDEKR